MKKHNLGMRRLSDATVGIAEATAERVRLGGEILKAPAHAVAANEKSTAKVQECSSDQAVPDRDHCGADICSGNWRAAT